MQSFPTKSHTNIQIYYQNASYANLYVNTSLIIAIIGILLTLRIFINKERRTQKTQQQIKKLEKIYLLECKDNNLR
jgi:membrane protein insertase Oxa1/YidC/SpoIIIJ